ncbi:hypothetical protein H0H87_010508, partial [Tephrocybe sp. NHM501043]
MSTSTAAIAMRTSPLARSQSTSYPLPAAPSPLPLMIQVIADILPFDSGSSTL